MNIANSADLAAWVQAGGTIIALVVAIVIARCQHISAMRQVEKQHEDALKRDERQHENALKRDKRKEVGFQQKAEIVGIRFVGSADALIRDCSKVKTPKMFMKHLAHMVKELEENLNLANKLIVHTSADCSLPFFMTCILARQCAVLCKDISDNFANKNPTKLLKQAEVIATVKESRDKMLKKVQEIHYIIAKLKKEIESTEMK